MASTLAMIGFGEAATTFLSGWDIDPKTVSVFDIKTDAAATRTAMTEKFAQFAVRGCERIADAVAGAELVISLVTADQAVAAARATASALESGALYVDGNSCAPGSKRLAAEAIEAAGGRYVDMAIMAPVKTKAQRTPLLLSGPDAGEAEARLSALGLAPAIAGEEIGQASTIKMLRSVMIKGLEALTCECLLAARRAGVEDAVLSSLQASDPGWDWRGRSGYNLERMMAHGTRRAAEMREVAETVRALGIANRLSEATAAWQEDVGRLELCGGDDAELAERADRILSGLKVER
ncbi:NAD(P)-dependent oxidoreductase [Aurantimonas sp. VKM B-3413]|uniref:DUF1932 domain-containing protein n=1 Tax=Aurantimonas sp. VKM B-3413 TaxID=2779401 RepID=UPI001E28D698|nr:NAD(P)-dependent oxidoreductase [Aurantimonas sp. VKM B-3413]MCB8837152.1 DUF1932 domain-containing protein [Aurantimonas sp. VKM B-3413]